MRRVNKLCTWVLPGLVAALLLGLSVVRGASVQIVAEQQGAAASASSRRIWITALEKRSIVDDLKKEDLRLFIGRQEQTILSLTFNPPVPITIGLLIDVSGSLRGVLPNAEEKLAADFLRRVMQPEDKAFVMEMDGKTQVVTQPTGDLAALQQGLDAVSTQKRWGSTALYDAICEAGDVEGSTPSQARILILVSDGVDSASHNSLEQALKCLQRTQSLLEFISVGPAEAKAQAKASHNEYNGRMPLAIIRRAEMIAEVSRVTGGTSYTVRDADAMSAAFSGMAELLRSRYAVDFEQTGASIGKKSEGIRVKCARRGVNILAPEVF